jgi:plastocyanin
MSHTPFLIVASVAALFATAPAAVAQSATSDNAHVIIVKLVVKPGSTPYTFEPSSVNAVRGDTVRFIDEEAVPHDVHFTSHPGGTKLGSITVGPYLTNKGQTYDVVIDDRFAAGKYNFVCDPHELLGMHGVLTVGERTVATNGNK